MEFLGEFQAMPILVLAAQLCPPGLESTIYSFLLSGYNLGLAVSSVLSAGLTAMLGVTSNSFARLSSLVIICAFTSYLPLLLIHLVPDEKDLERDLATNDDCEAAASPMPKMAKKGSGFFTTPPRSRSPTVSTTSDEELPSHMRSPTASTSNDETMFRSAPQNYMMPQLDAQLVADTGGEV
eukprot:Selendium_serpulae@DN5305_c0_g1_i2.p4